MNAPATRVLFISGYGRSGSTILGQVLGSAAAFVHVGELNFIWSRSLAEQGLCGCGLRFSMCPFWTEVMGRAFGGFDGVDIAEMERLQQLGTRTRHGMAMLLPSGRAGRARRMQPYVEAVERLYRAVGEVSGAAVVVDSSKLPTHGFLHFASPNVDLRVVHLIRDPRATAYSWLHQPQTDHGNQQANLPRVGAAKSSLTWDSWNAMTELFWRQNQQRYLRIRYEDFACEPFEVANDIAQFAGVHDAEFPASGPRSANLEVMHTVAGNPNRFAAGEVEIRADERWRGEMRGADVMAVTALTLPLLRRYGYPLAQGSDPSGTEDLSHKMT